MDASTTPVEPGSAEQPLASPPRRRFRIWPWLLLSCLCLATLGAGYVVVSLRQEPQFYQQKRAVLADPVRRAAAAEGFTTQATTLREAVAHQATWRVEFTEEQINAWLLEELPRHMDTAESRRIREPLVELAEGVVRVAARIELEEYRGVLSLEVRPRLEPGSQLILQLVSLKAGELPIPALRWMGRLQKHLMRTDWPVQIVRESPLEVQIDLPAVGRRWANVPLQELTVEPGRIALSGGAPAAP